MNDAAQQPESPPTQDDLVAHLRLMAKARTYLSATDHDALVEAADRIESAVERIRALEAEIEDYDALHSKLSRLLTGVANALKGEPPPLTMHSWHDLPELAAASRERERDWEEPLKLTDEMQREASAIYDENVRPGSSVMGAWRAIEAAIHAGYRMGQRDMRERAANQADDKFARILTYASENSDRYIAMRDAGHAIAITIRNLSIENANG